MLALGGMFHTTKGSVSHDELIAQSEGMVVTTTGGMPLLALRAAIQ